MTPESGTRILEGTRPQKFNSDFKNWMMAFVYYSSVFNWDTGIASPMSPGSAFAKCRDAPS